ncbi:tetratricopeptide repeat protein [Streptomyces sp. NPDC020983]|uniref:tetratricopeptide repeat protein n=1 Tax=Streptomyces sp. NPDC020983 TaxID=3365106 RepID=UPI0037A7985D
MGTGMDIRAAGSAVAAGWIEGDVHLHAAGRQPAQLPHQVGVVPSRALSFQVRAEAARLAAAVDGGGTAVLCQVLTGMGGVGKTQLAADLAHRSWDSRQVEVLVWVTAASRAAIIAAYAQAGEELCGADPADPEHAAAVFLAWLRAKQHRWLVVLDDIADPADVTSLWPPDSPTGRTLATTRRRDAALTGQGRHRIDVGVFSPAEAAAYLTGVLTAHGHTEPAGQLTALAENLGCLPLALSQAAAYLVDQAMPLAEYRALLADRTRTLDRALPTPGGLPDGQHHRVTAAWSLSVDLADAQGPPRLARRLLELTALLDPNGIPTPVLTSHPARMWCAAGSKSGSVPWRWLRRAVTAEQVYQALRVLDGLSLIDHTPATAHRAVRVHAMVQRTTRGTLTPRQHSACTRTAADALIAAWPEIERDTDLAQALRANTTALADHDEPAGCLYQPDTHDVLLRAGNSLGEASQSAAARDHFQHLADTVTRRLGPDHLDTLAIRADLARWRGQAGDPAGAAAAFTDLLHDQIRVLGADTVYALATRANLATWRRSADPAAAVTALTSVLDDDVRVLGPDHPATLITRHALAQSRRLAGDRHDATTALADLLQDRIRVLGPHHPDTLATRRDLAHWRGQAGDAAGAATALTALLDDMARVLGPDHPDILTTRHTLAYWQGHAGDPAGAATALTSLLEDMARVLRPNHPKTLSVRCEVAGWRGHSGDAAGAATALTGVLEDMARVLGPDHRDTLITRHNAARWWGQAGDAGRAATALTALQEDMARVLGPDNPGTLATRHNAAWWRGKAGDAAGAATALTALLDDVVRVLGPDHLDTLTTRGNLAHWRGEAGQAPGAAAAFAELLEDYVRVLGPDHPGTLATRSDLAHWRELSGEARGTSG